MFYVVQLLSNRGNLFVENDFIHEQFFLPSLL